MDMLRYEYQNCVTGKSCKTMVDGKIFTCYRAAMLYCMNGTIDENEYVQLKETDTAEEKQRKIKEIFLKEYSIACDYCDMAADWTRDIPAGMQMERRR